jgi:hypothetical protein
VDGVVLAALVCTRLAGVSTGFGEVAAVVGVACHEAGVQRGDIGDVATEPSALLHLLVAEALVGTPLTDFCGLVADLDTLVFFLTQVVDLGNCVCKRHHVLLCHSDSNRHFACQRKAYYSPWRFQL